MKEKFLGHFVKIIVERFVIQATLRNMTPQLIAHLKNNKNPQLAPLLPVRYL